MYFRKVADRLVADGILNPKVLKVDVNALIYQVPGGMLSNLISLARQNAFCFLGDGFVSLAHKYVKHRLRADNLACRSYKRRISQIFSNVKRHESSA